MFEVEVMVLETKRTFIKVFDSYYLFKQYCKKCKHSNKIKIINTSEY